MLKLLKRLFEQKDTRAPIYKMEGTCPFGHAWIPELGGCKQSGCEFKYLVK